MKNTLLLFGLFSLVLMTPSAAVAAGCESNADCKAGRMCQAGRCVQALTCTKDVDCGGDDVCVADRCVAPGAVEAVVAPEQASAWREESAAVESMERRRPVRAAPKSRFAADISAGVGAGISLVPTFGDEYASFGNFTADVFGSAGFRLKREFALMFMLDTQFVHYFSDGLPTTVNIAPGVGIRYGLGSKARMSVGVAPRIWFNDGSVNPSVMLGFMFPLGESGLQLRASPKFDFEFQDGETAMTSTLTLGIGWGM